MANPKKCSAGFQPANAPAGAKRFIQANTPALQFFSHVLRLCGKALSLPLRARQEIRCAFWRERRPGRCEAPRRRRCRCASSRSGNKADARPPPRPSGLRPAGPLAVLLAPYIPHRVCSSLAPCQRAWGPAAECTPYFLTGPNHGFALFASSRLTQVQFHGGGFTLPQ